MSGDLWATPQWLFDWACEHYGNFDLDVCAQMNTAKVLKFYSVEEDGLSQEWGDLNWCNPPYSDPMPWIEKAGASASFGKRTVLLLPADLSTKWAKLAWSLSDEIKILNHRVKFEGATGSPKFSSMFVRIPSVRHGRYFGDPRVSLIDLREYKTCWEIEGEGR